MLGGITLASVYDLKPRFQAMLRPLTGGLASKGVSANMVTIAAAALSIVTGLLILWLGEKPIWLLLLPACLFVRMALNAIDGMLAREHGQKSALGALLNELGDVVSDAALYLPLAIVLVPFGMTPALAVLFVVTALLSEFAGVAALMVGAERVYDGPMGKSDRAASIGFVAAYLGLGFAGGWWVDLTFAILIILCIVTVGNRMRAALAWAKDNNA